ncbi:MAG: hypothetical protein H7Z16_06205 [Pyrinomonadaceae bacterium]|nr:hypothetical protein [Pyrinomonadaceae bacterium]
MKSKKKDAPKKSKTDPIIPKSYSLDVAFSSATRSLPKQGQQPIYAMGYGFSEFPGRVWEGKGQSTLKVEPGSLFYFTAFDTADKPQKVTTFEVDFHGGRNPFDSTGPIKVTGKGISSQPGQSAGCNVIGLYSIIGPYTVAPETKTQNFECTVKVTTTRKGKIFQVDPEIQVEGGG